MWKDPDLYVLLLEYPGDMLEAAGGFSKSLLRFLCFSILSSCGPDVVTTGIKILPPPPLFPLTPVSLCFFLPLLLHTFPDCYFFLENRVTDKLNVDASICLEVRGNNE